MSTRDHRMRPASRGDTMRHDETDCRELSATQALALAALLEGASVIDAAGRAGVSRQTVHPWLRDDPAFLAAHNEGRAEMVRLARVGLRGLAGEAVRAFKEILGPPDEKAPVPAAIRLRAALEVLRMAGCDGTEPIGESDPATVRPTLAVASVVQSTRVIPLRPGLRAMTER